MKVLFKLVLTFIVITTFNTNVFSAEPLVSYVVRAGANFSSISGNFDNKKSQFGYRAGVFLDYGARKGFVRTGLGVTTKDFSLEKAGVAYSASLTYAEIPLNAGLRFRLSDNVKLVFVGGPYLGYGLKGKWDSAKNDLEEDAFAGANFIKFDYGMRCATGLVFRSIEIDCGGEFGIANIIQDTNYKGKSQNFYLTLGYRF